MATISFPPSLTFLRPNLSEVLLVREGPPPALLLQLLLAEALHLYGVWHEPRHLVVLLCREGHHPWMPLQWTKSLEALSSSFPLKPPSCSLLPPLLSTPLSLLSFFLTLTTYYIHLYILTSYHGLLT